MTILFKKCRFLWLVALISSIIAAVLFFAPIIYALLHVKAYDDIKEAEIFFVSFFFENKFFILHAFAVLLSFLAFLTAVFSFFKEKKRLILAFFAAFISLVVILLYVLGYDVLFQISLIL